MNTDAYLKRLNYQGPLSPTAETLRALQLAHLRNVPFENLSIHSGEPIVLQEEALFTKIVERRRGGFCYEVNGLFASLLRSLGFDVTMLSAGVAKPGGGFSPDFDHMALMVKLSDRWLVDVGFGDSFLEPLLLDGLGEQIQGSQSFQLLNDGSHLVLMRRNKGEEWKPEYRFNLQPHTFADYEEMCEFHQTSPESHFTKARICSRATDEGRVTLSDMRLITTNGSQRDERVLASSDEYERVLRDQFGIVMKGSNSTLKRL
jgi:N-hydroxyarylamine O-acetyltransferase